MSDPRYKAGITARILLSHAVGHWPAAIAGMGARVLAVFGLCEVCKHRQKRPDQALDGGWFTYGGHRLCKRHAQELATKRAAKEAA